MSKVSVASIVETGMKFEKMLESLETMSSLEEFRKVSADMSANMLLLLIANREMTQKNYKLKKKLAMRGVRCK